MNITDIKIRKTFDQPILKAVVSITINDEIAIHDIKVIQRQTGCLFVAMPSRRYDTGVHRDIAHPIDSEARKSLEKQVLSEYYNQVEKLNLSLKPAVIDGEIAAGCELF